MTILQIIADSLVSICDSQLDFVPERGTADAIFVVWQMQEKCLALNKHIYMAFLALVNAFNCVPQIFIWWALRKLCYPGSEHQCTKPCLCCLWLQPRVYGDIVVHHGSCLVICSSSLCWRHCHVCCALELPVRISIQIILSLLLNRWRNMSGGS